MNDDLKRLYRTLGFTGSLTEEATAASFAAAAEEAPAELPPLDAAGLDQLEEMLNREPRKTLARVREIWDAGMTQKRLRAAIAIARQAIATPGETADAIEAETMSFAMAGAALPPDFNFPGMDLDEI